MIQDILANPPLLYALTFVAGAITGNFLNILALRSLEEKSIFGLKSNCPKCKKSISLLDQIPIISYFALKGRCRNCQSKISWHYPVVELFTALWFMLVVYTFGITYDTLGMLFFSSALIAICVTDFREKLIPHEITYPSIIIGLIFSAYIRKDFMGAMVGVGASYILFDYLAFYGLKLYLHQHPELNERDDDNRRTQRHIAYAKRQLRRKSALASRGGKGFKVKRLVSRGTADREEDIEVMGGGDAVLSALISAWLGWQSLCVALLIGFLSGCLLGAVYLMVEMHKASILKKAVVPSIVGFLAAFSLVFGVLFALSKAMGMSGPLPGWVLLAVFSGLCGALLGVILKGKPVSKPFPFGPALAVGAAAAIFYSPEIQALDITGNATTPLQGKSMTRLWQQQRLEARD